MRFVLGIFAMIGALAFLGCPWRALLRFSAGDLNAVVGLLGLAAGISVGLVQATKETSVLAFAAMVIALVLTALWNRVLPVASSGVRVRIRWWPLAAGVAAARRGPGRFAGG